MEELDLLAETKNALFQVKEQEFEIQRQADEAGIPVMQMRYSDGTMAMAPTLLAKAQLLGTLYALERDQKTEEQQRKILDWFSGLRTNQQFLNDKE
jgi:hypothetical protein